MIDKRADNKIKMSHRDGQQMIAWAFASLILLQLAGLFSPPHLSWGFNYWQLFSIEFAIVVLGLALITLHPVVSLGVTNSVDRLFSSSSKIVGGWYRPLVILIVSLLLCLLFYLLRSQAHVYGDGFLVPDRAANPIGAWPFNEYFMKPLSMLLNRFFFFLFTPGEGVESAKLISGLNVLAGVVGFWAMFRLSHLLVSGVLRRWFLLLGSLVSGSLVLFFGYHEYYSWPVALTLWSLTFSVGYLKDKNPLWPALLVSVLATGFHLFATPVIMVPLIAGWIKPSKGNSSRRSFSFLGVNLAVVGLSLVAGGLYQLGAFNGPVIPLWPTANTSYLAFSLSHLLDMMNEIILVAPLGLVGIVVALLNFKRHGQVDRSENLIFSASLFLFLFSFWLNPELGAARDWDLLSFYGLPFSLWGTYTLLKYLPEQAISPPLLFQMLVLGTVVLVPNLYEKNDLGVAATRLDEILWHDPHYQIQYKESYNSYQWAGTLFREVGDSKRSIRHLKRSIEGDDPPARRFVSLGTAYERLGYLDSAYSYVHRGLEKYQGNAKLLNKIFSYEFKANRPDRMLTFAQRAVEINPDAGDNQYLLSVALGQLGANDSALVHSRLAYKLEPGNRKMIVQLGRLYGAVGQHDSAYFTMMEAMDLAGPGKLDKFDYSTMFFGALSLGRFNHASRALKAIERFEPVNPTEIDSLWKVFEETVESSKSDD